MMKLGLIGSAALAFAAVSCSADRGSDERVATSEAALESVTSFGSNPGALQMYRYVPAAVPANAPVVVVLHGCTQSAADFVNAGWNPLADKYKFYVVYPQQPSANNPSTCFDWFGKYNTPSDKTNLTRGQGENLSIKQMVDKMKQDYSVDASRVFVAGFSAGAAFVSVMLATWPDVFAAGGMGEGIPYNCPSTQNTDVFQCMNPGKTLPASDWGDRVRAAYAGYAGPWPRVSIWEGTQDTTVGTTNATQLVAQWTNVHGLSATPSAQDTVDGQAHAVFNTGNGQTRVESYSISGMAHGFAVDPAHGCGAPSTYLLDKHICAAHHMLRFFGIADPMRPTDAGSDGSVPPDAASIDGGLPNDGSAPPDASIDDAAAVIDASGDASGSHDASTSHDASAHDAAVIDSGARGDGSDAHASGDTPSPSGGLAGCGIARRENRAGDSGLVLAAVALVSIASQRRRTRARGRALR